MNFFRKMEWGFTRLLELFKTLPNLFRKSPLLRSVKELHPLCEHFTIKENGDYKFSRTSFAFVTKTNEVYFGRSTMRKYDLTVSAINASLRRVPDHEIYPAPPPSLTLATASKEVYCKGPMLAAYDSLQNTGQVARMLLQEVEIYQLLQTHPHPNLVRYHGCKVARGCVIAIVLEHYDFLLEHYLRQHARDCDVRAGFNGIRAGVQHLHSLGLAHNDIKPSNIMVDQFGKWVLIDMGSCVPFGKPLTSAGTSGWYDDDWITSEKEHDEAALSKLWDWLQSVVQDPVIT